MLSWCWNSFRTNAFKSWFDFQHFYFKKAKSQCDICLSVRKILSHVKADLRSITVSQAITLFEVFQLKNSYGKLICRNCRLEVSKKTDATREKLHNDAFQCLFDPESVCCVEERSWLSTAFWSLNWWRKVKRTNSNFERFSCWGWGWFWTKTTTTRFGLFQSLIRWFESSCHDLDFAWGWVY